MSWQAVDGVFVEEIDGEMILLDSAGNRYLTLNETGAAIFDSAKAGSSLDSIVERLVEGWAVSPEVARSRATDFISKLVDAKILAPK